MPESLWAKRTVCDTLSYGLSYLFHQSGGQGSLVRSSFDRQNVINQVQQLRELAFARKFDIYQEDIDEETSEIALRTSFLALSRSAV
jgi:hypothetical protein